MWELRDQLDRREHPETVDREGPPVLPDQQDLLAREEAMERRDRKVTSKSTHHMLQSLNMG